MDKRCSRCREVKSLEEFHRERRRPDGRTCACAQCRCAIRRASRAPIDPLIQRGLNLLYKFGMTLTQYDELLASQGGACALPSCGVRDRPGAHLHIDHCHTTGRVRGLLCQAHNLALGQFDDSRTLLLEAAAYLHQEPHLDQRVCVRNRPSVQRSVG